MQSPATTVSGDHWVAEEIGGVHLRGPLVISENGTCNRDRHPLGTNTQGARCVPVSRSFASIPRVESGLCWNIQEILGRKQGGCVSRAQGGTYK